MPSRLRNPLIIFGISKGKFQRLQKISLYLLGHFQEKYQRAKNNSVQPGQNFQNSLPTKLVRSVKPHLCPSWTEVEKLTSTQVVSKSKITSTQLAEKSGFNFYSDCVEVKKLSGNFIQDLPRQYFYNNVIPYTKILNKFVKWVDLFTSFEYNNSVIAEPQNSNNSVKECFYGTIDFE